MGWRIEIERRDYEQLRAHLNGSSEEEQVAFLLTAPYAGDEVLEVVRIQLIDAESFNFQSGYHVELADDVRPNLIKRAWEAEACVIEAHSHLNGPSRFSASDLAGFDEWVPHMRWRLRGRPYAALVFASDDFDALVWEGEGRPVPLDSLDIVDGPVVRPTGITHTSLASNTPGTPQPAREERPSKKSLWRRLLVR